LVRDPGPLFEILDATPFAYWANIPRFADKYGYHLWPELDVRSVQGVQGGQYLIDIQKAWAELMFCRWWDNHADFFYTQSGNCDEDGWRTVCAKTRNYTLLGNADYEKIGFVCRYDGKPYICHRTNAKLSRDKATRTNRSWPHEARVMELFRELVPPAPPESQQARMARLRSERQKVLHRV